MEKVLAGLPLTVCLIYLDDILVPHRTFTDHTKNLLVLLREAKLKLFKEVYSVPMSSEIPWIHYQ